MTVVIDFRTGSAVMIPDPAASPEIAEAARTTSNESDRSASTR